MSVGKTIRLSRQLMSAFLVAVVLVAAVPVRAAPPVQNVVLPAPRLEQKFKPPERSVAVWDFGDFDCLPASVAMVLQTLEREKLLTGGRSDYPTIRRAFRQLSPDAGKGIDSDWALTVVPWVTNNQITTTILLTDTVDWPSVLERQLTAGFPVIATFEDWRRLAGPKKDGAFPHSITIVGLKDGNVLYNDPWDGGQYSMPVDSFGEAWALTTGKYKGWRYGLTFAQNRQTSPTPASPEALIEESASVMRGLAALDVQFEGDAIALTASGQLTLAKPDILNGQASFAGVALSASTADGQTEIRVSDQPIATVPAADVAPKLLDLLIELPTIATDWKLREEGDQYRLEGRLTPETLEALGSVTGLVIPGDPHGRLTLTVAKKSKVWRESRLTLIWPVVQWTFLGRELEFGPTASVSFTFRARP